MGNKNGQRGAKAERDVANWLTSFGFTEADRKVKHGQWDKGDIAGITNVVVEVKDHVRITLSDYQKELQTEVDNAHARLGLAAVKRRGTLDVGRWYWLIDPRHVPFVIRACQHALTCRHFDVETA